MKRLKQFGTIHVLAIFFALAAHGSSAAQDKIPQAKKAEQPSFTPVQKQVIKALSLESPFTFMTDEKGKFERTSFAYTEVNFVGSCRLHYVAHEYIVKDGVGGNDNVHHYTPTNVDLADLVAGDPRVVKASEISPPPSDFRYSADAYVVDFPGRSGKAAHRLTFEGEQGAHQFLALLRKAAQSCPGGQ